MKTKNVFDLTTDQVMVSVFDVTDIQKGEKMPEGREPLETHIFVVSDVPAELEDGENSMKSLAAYGLSRLLQDRNSSVTDSGEVAQACSTVEELAAARMEAYKGTYETVLAGMFREKRASGTGAKAAAVCPFFAQAFVELAAKKGKELTVEVATMILQKLSKEERKAMRTALVGRINELKAAATQQASDFDISDLF